MSSQEKRGSPNSCMWISTISTRWPVLRLFKDYEMQDADWDDQTWHLEPLTTMSRQSISTIFEMWFLRLKLISWLKMLRSLGLNMRPTVLKNRGSFIWLVQRQDGPNQENSSYVETVIRLLTELLEPSPLGLGLVRLSMSSLPRPSGKLNPRKCW